MSQCICVCLGSPLIYIGVPVSCAAVLPFLHSSVLPFFVVNIYAWSADIIYLTQALLKHVMILVKTKMVDSQFIVKKYM